MRARPPDVVADELDGAAPREIAAIDPRAHAWNEAVVDELPAGLVAVAADAHEEAARAKDLEHGEHLVAAVLVADHREQLGFGAHRALVVRGDERDEQIARDVIAAVRELGV